MKPHIGGGAAECAEIVKRGFVPRVRDVQSFKEKG